MLKCKELAIQEAKKKLSNSPNFIFEHKIDGFRCLYKDGYLFSERKIIQNSKYPHLIEELKGINGVLDGEISVDDNLFKTNTKSNWLRAKYYCFDVLFFNGDDVRNLPLFVRQHILKEVIKEHKLKNIVMPKQFKDLNTAWEWVLKNNKEGLVAKNINSHYPIRDLFKEVRNNAWIKIKNRSDVKIEIVGWEKGEIHGTFLLKGNKKVSALSTRYVNLYQQLKKKGRVFAEIEFLNKTANGNMFQPVLKKLTL